MLINNQTVVFLQKPLLIKYKNPVEKTVNFQQKIFFQKLQQVINRKKPKMLIKP